MHVGLEIDTPQRHATYAWAFLEDIYRLRTVDIQGDSRLLHVTRLLGACATSLRSACESKFGEKKLHLAPNQGAMWLITAARHPSAHGIERDLRANTHKVNLHWENDKNTGWVETEGSVTLNLDEPRELKSLANRDQALRFFAKHDHRLYLALHAATRLVAEWVGLPLDSDFEAIGKADHGFVRFRVPLKSPEEFHRALRAHQGEGNFEIPIERLDRKGWGIEGQWDQGPPGTEK